MKKCKNQYMQKEPVLFEEEVGEFYFGDETDEIKSNPKSNYNIGIKFGLVLSSILLLLPNLVILLRYKQ